jgi:hypothetical protein
MSRISPTFAITLVVVTLAMMVHWKAALFAGLTSAAAIFHRDGDSADALAACPGYKASNVHVTPTGVTADLTLAGAACNVYGTDLPNLILQVTYQTGKSSRIAESRPSCCRGTHFELQLTCYIAIDSRIVQLTSLQRTAFMSSFRTKAIRSTKSPNPSSRGPEAQFHRN